MTVSVLIPFGTGPEPNRWREHLLAFVADRWTTCFPQFELVIGSGGWPFSRSRARNDAAARASGDTFIFCDADTTFASSAQIERGLRVSTWARPLVYCNTTKDFTLEVLNNPASGGLLHAEVPDTEHILSDSPGGILMMSREQFADIGGFDESFIGWGYEDNAFCLAAETICGRGHRVFECIHLWHPRSEEENFGQPSIHHNQQRFELYQVASKRRDLSRLRSLARGE